MQSLDCHQKAQCDLFDAAELQTTEADLIAVGDQQSASIECVISQLIGNPTESIEALTAELA